MTTVTDSLTGSSYAVCAIDRIVAFAWTDVPTMDGAVAMTSVFDRVHARVAGRLAMLIMVSPAASRLIPAAVREHLTREMKLYAPKISAVAYVFERTGFEATVVRSVITAMNMISRPTYWVSVFADRTRAVTELLAHMNEATSATSKDVLAALEGLTRRDSPVASGHSL